MKTIQFAIFSTLFYFSAHAVNISPGGYGEAVILPYYTVNNGLNTLLTINNSTDQVKAVKIHFREGKEGKAVLSFNAYLAPQDIWVAGLISKTSTLPGHAGEESAAIVRVDQSCVPFLPTLYEFLPYEIEAESEDTNLKRSREGYIEILEMGELDPSSGLGQAATFVYNSEVPRACADIEAAFAGGIWNETDGDLTEQMLPVTGGLSASVGIIDVAEGTLYSYDGVAFENFYPAGSIFHTSTGDTRVPSLEQADTTSVIFNNGETVTTEWEQGYQAISALLMKKQVESFYTVDSLLDAKTEMVLSYPTKRLHPIDEPPFAEMGTAQDAGCVNYNFNLYDRESKNQCLIADNCPYYNGESPQPPTIYTQMCGSINVLQMLSQDTAQNELPSRILGSAFFDYRNIKPVSQYGKIIVDFSQNMTAPNNDSYSGVPVIALTFEKYTNGNAAPGLMAQYGGIYSAKYQTEVVND